MARVDPEQLGGLVDEREPRKMQLRDPQPVLPRLFGCRG
jgi:hypothetical protein